MMIRLFESNPLKGESNATRCFKNFHLCKAKIEFIFICFATNFMSQYWDIYYSNINDVINPFFTYDYKSIPNSMFYDIC